MQSSKVCNKCKENLPLSMFHRCRAASDGHRGMCKECRSIDERRFYNREKRVKNLQRHWANNKNKKKARDMISTRVACGTITPEPCELCGEAVVQAHHEDYSRPLEVRWLCRQHHLEQHGKIAHQIAH